MSQSNIVAGVAGAIIGYALKQCDAQPSLPVEPCDPNQGDPNDGPPGIVYVPKEIPEGNEPIEVEGDGYLYLEWSEDEDPELFFYEKAGFDRPSEMPDEWLFDGHSTDDPIGYHWRFRSHLLDEHDTYSDYTTFSWFFPTSNADYDYTGKDLGPISLQSSLGSVAFAVRTSLELETIANRALIDTGDLMPRAASIDHALFSDQLWNFACDQEVVDMFDALPQYETSPLKYSDLIALGKDTFLAALDEYCAALIEWLGPLPLTAEIGFLENAFNHLDLSPEARALGPYDPYNSAEQGFAAHLIHAQLVLAHKDAIVDQLGGSLLRSIEQHIGVGTLPISYGNPSQIVASLRTIVPDVTNYEVLPSDWRVYARALTVATWLGADLEELEPLLIDPNLLAFASFASLYGSKVDHETAAKVGDYVPRPTFENDAWVGTGTGKRVDPPVIGTEKTEWKLARITYAPKPPVSQWVYKGGF